MTARGPRSSPGPGCKPGPGQLQLPDRGPGASEAKNRQILGQNHPVPPTRYHPPGTHHPVPGTPPPGTPPPGYHHPGTHATTPATSTAARCGSPGFLFFTHCHRIWCPAVSQKTSPTLRRIRSADPRMKPRARHRPGLAWPGPDSASQTQTRVGPRPGLPGRQRALPVAQAGKYVTNSSERTREQSPACWAVLP